MEVGGEYEVAMNIVGAKKIFFNYIYWFLYYKIEDGTDYATCVDMVRNVQNAISLIRYLERYSGIKRAVIASCFGDEPVSVQKVATILKVWERVVHYSVLDATQNLNRSSDQLRGKLK